MYAVTNRNGKIISRHRTIAAAVKADRKLQRRHARANGWGRFYSTEIAGIDKYGYACELSYEEKDAVLTEMLATA